MARYNIEVTEVVEEKSSGFALFILLIGTLFISHAMGCWGGESTHSQRNPTSIQTR